MVVSGKLKPALAAEGLVFGYSERPVVDGVDLEIFPGDIVGIIGPNGSGKSTLLGLLCGLLTPSQGLVSLLGRPIQEYGREEVAQVLGVVPQTPELTPGFSILETVLIGRFALMGRRLFEDAEDLAAARRALTLTGLENLTDRRAGELSGGERQRLVLARALAAEPKVLLLDEPTSALDLDYQLKVMSLLEKACAQENLAVGLVSHDLNLAAMYCHRLVLLSQGRPLAQGPPEKVLTPENLLAAYGVKTLVDQEPTRGRPRVTLKPPQPAFDPL